MRKLIYLFTAIGILTFYGCAMNKMMKMSKEQQLTVDPDPLEVHADKVDFEMSAVLPVKMLKPNLTYTMQVHMNMQVRKTNLMISNLMAVSIPTQILNNQKYLKNLKCHIFR